MWISQALDVDRNGFISFEELKEGMLSVLHEDVGSQGANADPLQYQEKMIQLVRAMQYRMKVLNCCCAVLLCSLHAPCGR